MKHISIAIDGPAGAGKSTLARQAAQRLGFLYVDTGAIYRTVALKALESYDTQLDKTAIRPYSLNPYINAILSVYINRAKGEGFTVSVHINFPEKVPILEEQLAVVLANLLENGIRITSREPKDKRFLDVHLQVKGQQAILAVENYCSKPIDFDKDGFPRTSRKGHGIGMISIRKFIE